MCRMIRLSFTGSRLVWRPDLIGIILSRPSARIGRSRPTSTRSDPTVQQRGTDTDNTTLEKLIRGPPGRDMARTTLAVRANPKHRGLSHMTHDPIVPAIPKRPRTADRHSSKVVTRQQLRCAF